MPTRVAGHRNAYATVWKCKQCGNRTAEQYTCLSKRYNRGLMQICQMAIAEGDDEDNSDIDDDEIARLDTMCTSTMHGDQWLKRYREILKNKYGMDVVSEVCHVRYRFGGGESKIAKQRDTVPIGIKGVNGEIASRRIPNSPTTLLLSITSQKALGLSLIHI